MTANAFINVLIKQSLRTFRMVNCNPELFTTNLQNLKHLMDNLTSEHVNLDHKFQIEETWNRPGKAPMTYIQIYNDRTINVGIFILKPGMKLPLHDHPYMYGLLKVICGKAKIENYSIEPKLTERITQTASSSSSGSDDYDLNRKELVAKRNPDIVADHTSECCVLRPLERNLHEIESIDGACAFLDVLSPPYDVYVPEYGPRKCSYYSLFQELEPDIFHLLEIGSPHWFWSDEAPYKGPKLHIENIESDTEIAEQSSK
ncbi:2-aminoethanethiol dioxygenase [Chrysoperla carnea]|uniref:2-aminoethanethiol dioxygenase n=1 Tax=Chrysoperla carnea TaxID=189513 RepID=UPI001D080E90|nr:2-aminoethanethiol dioxygenase [Chrysoperla carnea]